MKIEYSYTLRDERMNSLETKTINEERYNEILNSDKFKLKEEWQTDFNDSTLYMKWFKGQNGWNLFVSKEVAK